MSERVNRHNHADTVKSLRDMPRLARAATVGALGLSATFGLTGCGNGDGESGPNRTAHTYSPQNTRGAEQPPEGDDQSPVITFNTHGSDVKRGGSSIVMLYTNPGPDGKGSYDGVRYANGQEVAVDCVARGRIVRRHPEQGEEPGQSRLWARIAGVDHPEFAPLAYADTNFMPSQMPRC